LTSVSGFAQSFPAVVERGALPVLRRELAAGRGGCFEGFQTACAERGQALTVTPVETLAQAGQVSHAGLMPAARWFLNVNRPEDLRRAERHMGAHIA
jgi:hypothetical protein